MFRSLYPNEYMESTYRIPFHELAGLGYRGILFDIDNTLVPHGAPADEQAVALFGMLHSLGLRTCLISNNQEPRVAPFAEAVESFYLCNARKPSRKGYREACRIMNVDPAEAVFVGDQIFTDVWGANMAGIKSILVRPIHPKEEIQIVLKRRLEWFVLRAYLRGGWKRVPGILEGERRSPVR